jgi:hypothetical protein
LEPLKAKLTILQIRDSITATVVDANHLHGTLAVVIHVDDRWIECGVVRRLELAAQSSGSEIVMDVALPVAPATTATVYFKTDGPASNGQPRTPNGTYSLVARAYDKNGTLLLARSTGLLAIDNP